MSDNINFAIYIIQYTYFITFQLKDKIKVIFCQGIYLLFFVVVVRLIKKCHKFLKYQKCY